MSNESEFGSQRRPRVHLETERMLLREFTTDDADDLLALHLDPEVMRFVGGVTETREDIEQDYIPAYLAYYTRGEQFGFWVAVEKASNQFLGWFHYRPMPGSGSADPELGYRLHRSTWGKGYATEGARALIDLGFSRYGVERVVASTYAINTASRRVMEKLGMTQIRTFRLTPDDPHGDAVEYALTRADWQKQQFAPR